MKNTHIHDCIEALCTVDPFNKSLEKDAEGKYLDPAAKPSIRPKEEAAPTDDKLVDYAE